MRRAWLQVSMLVLLCTALVAAPCKNCQPSPQAESRSEHDCCPKPRSQPVKTCLWQPADFDAVDSTHKVEIRLPAMPAAPLAVRDVVLESVDERPQPVPVWSSPPIYVVTAALLI